MDCSAQGSLMFCYIRRDKKGCIVEEFIIIGIFAPLMKYYVILGCKKERFGKGISPLKAQFKKKGGKRNEKENESNRI